MRTAFSSRLFPSVQPGRLARSLHSVGVAALLTLSAAAAPLAFAQSGMNGMRIDATGDAKSEMAACQSGMTPQARAVCITEVRNAQAARRAGKLENYGDFTANAMKRCDVFKASEDQAACRARVGDQATLDGSVASGGILREAEITVPAEGGMDTMPMHNAPAMSADTMTKPMPMTKPQYKHKREKMHGARPMPAPMPSAPQ
ncbi:hypothetical protein BH10PSE16_BH10PSE16_02920 [soil metagenome]